MEDTVVLLVDDDSVFTDIIGNHLMRQGIKCLYAPSGVIACDMLEKDPLPGAILLDVRMPDIDGFVVLERIKKIPRTASIPVVMYSNDPEEDTRERATKLGAVAYLEKVSVTPNEVADTIKKVLTR